MAKNANELPLMPKATAVWLVDNTSLSFQQIADFCGLHPLEIQGIADGEVAAHIIGVDPIAGGQLTRGQIEAAEANPAQPLTLESKAREYLSSKKQQKGGRYTPVARRRDKPDAVAYMVKNFPEMSDAAIGKLLGTTKTTIQAIRNKSHWNIQNIKPKDPVLVGICSQVDLDRAVTKARLEAEKSGKAVVAN